MEFYQINEQQVYDKALCLYSNALKLDPTNFPLASDVAQTYYGIKPLRLEDALKAWTNTLALAHDEIEREGVYLHFARLKLQADRFAEVRATLTPSLTNLLPCTQAATRPQPRRTGTEGARNQRAASPK